MKLQIALDEQTIEAGITLCRQIVDYVDIIEIGTPFIVREGLHAVRAFREAFPGKQLLADAKIMDAGTMEATDCFAAGADFVTVLGVTDLLTVKACQEVAQAYHGRIVVDMLCVEDIPRRVKQLEACGIRDLAVHTGIDQQHAGRTPLDDLRQLRSCTEKSQIFVAGGIHLATVEQYKQAGADVVIVGGGIAHAEDPREAAMAISKKIGEKSHGV